MFGARGKKRTGAATKAAPAAAAPAAAPAPSTAATEVPDFVIPGDKIKLGEGELDMVRVGEGVERRGDGVFSTSTGVLKRQRTGDQVQLRVSRRRKEDPTPTIGSIVLGKVLKVAGGSATVEIFGVDGCHSTSDFRGSIRTDDARDDVVQMDTLKAVEVWQFFRPGDVIRAEVIGYGDRRSYQLGTLRPELGVLAATSSAGHEMLPFDSETMQCLVTSKVERRKVAMQVEDSLWWTRAWD
eukprot:TRINITY_DN7968_c0_g1_i1.p2 TRINITY_DN7968_c0_g1~~TRINITY_DN7968_c0_g1_i1.p2  ORF type:complete len:240 (+),score=66.68 TRINITY_DN7968_c0_g1_i1:61-780(+)